MASPVEGGNSLEGKSSIGWQNCCFLGVYQRGEGGMGGSALKGLRNSRPWKSESRGSCCSCRSWNDCCHRQTIRAVKGFESSSNEFPEFP